jgi:hypothetical protein
MAYKSPDDAREAIGTSLLKIGISIGKGTNVKNEINAYKIVTSDAVKLTEVDSYNNSVRKLLAGAGMKRLAEDF